MAEHEATLCPGCGHPKRLAWHSHMEGFYEPLRWVCHACTAQSGSEVAYQLAEIDDDLPEAKMADFPPFELGITTTDPSPSRSET